MTFTRVEGEVVRKWWEERCIEWCFARVEDGKFGDQKYLDDWPVRFESYVHVLERQEWSQAPWNASRYPFGQGVFYHFHGLRIAEMHKIDLGEKYVLPPVLIKNVYEPYINDLSVAIKAINNLGLIVVQQTKPTSTLKLFKRLLSGLYFQLWRFHSLNFRKY
jgi:hypothetical protein